MVAKILSLGVALATLGAFVSIAVVARPDGFLDFHLDPGGEGNVFAWASTVATFSAAYASLLLAFAEPGRWLRFGALAVSFALLSLDDMIGLHELAGEKVFGNAFDLPENVSQQLEVLLYAPLFAFALWTVWTLVGETSREIGRVLVAGVSLLGFAVALEIGGLVTRRLDEHGVRHVNGARLALEEASELAGWILVATGLTALACSVLSRKAEADESGQGVVWRESPGR